MDSSQYTKTISVNGREVPYDPVNSKVLTACHRCGAELEAMVRTPEDEKVAELLKYNCPECDYWYSID